MLGPDGASATVMGIDPASARVELAYDLTIDVTHTYHVTAGPTAVLVHNTGDCDDFLPDAPSALPDETFLARGGTNTPKRFASGSGVTIDPSGNLSGVSVNSGATDFRLRPRNLERTVHPNDQEPPK